MAALASLTAHELGARYRSGEATPTQAATEYLARIEALDPEVRAFLTVTREDALRRAAEADARFRARTPRGPLDGAPARVLGRARDEAQLRARLALRGDRLRLVARPGRPLRRGRGGRGPDARGHRGSRPDGRHRHRRPRARLPGRARAGDRRAAPRGARRVLHRRLGPRGRAGGARRDRHAREAGRAHRAGVAAPYRVRAGRLLRHRARGGLVEPRPLRRGEVRAAGPRRARTGRHVLQDAGGRLRRRGEAAGDAWGLCDIPRVIPTPPPPRTESD